MTVELAYEEAGDGPPVVLAGSLGSDRRMWDPVWVRLTGARDGLRVDLRGFGESTDRPARLAPHEDVLAVLAAQGIERAHVVAFRELLGNSAVKRPEFDFQGTTEDSGAFLKTAVALEDLAVAAYKGQAPRLRSRPDLAAALSIHSVEARHAAWMRELFGVTPAVNAFDKPATKQDINRIVASTHFIVAHPKMKARSKPQYTG